MITKEQALNLHHGSIIHYEGCKRTVGPRGGVKEYVERYRVASQVKTWVTRPGCFRFTVKYGMRPDTYEISEENADQFHLESECPLNAD